MTPTAWQRLRNGLRLVRATIAQHGGGWRGCVSVAARTGNVVRVLGWKGLLRWAHAAGERAAASVRAPTGVVFPPPTALADITLKVGVMAHVFYVDLVDELATRLAHIPVPFTLLVSVVDTNARECVKSRLASLPMVRGLRIRIVPNRGRDIAPLLVTFRDDILALDVIAHLHTKKSIYTGKEQGQWRHYLFDALLGSEQRVTWILGTFQAMPELGMVYPDSFRRVPPWAYTWLANVDVARLWGPLLGIAINPHDYFDFPAGSMFWARTQAIRPLYELGLTTESFPVESNQTDATLQHAMERFLGLVVPHQGMLAGIMPADGAQTMSTQGARNWGACFTLPLNEKIAQAAVGARHVSFDMFDTLVLRPFLTAHGARAHLTRQVEKRFGLKGFSRLREQAENIARKTLGHDPALADIYAAFVRLPLMHDAPVDDIKALELATEQRLLQPRPACLDAARQLAHEGMPVTGLSDMYLSAADLQHVLPPAVSAALQTIAVSCDTHRRKDTGEAWQHLKANADVEAGHWLHVGDNERADIQAPQERGFMPPVHVLRPQALLQVVPALRALHPPTTTDTHWADDLWLGLIANRLTVLADGHPEAFRGTLTLDGPETFGYVVLGPLLADYLTWLGRQALEHDIEHIAFLSREGYLLERLYRHLQQAVPALRTIKDSYLLASRRGLGTPSIRRFEDIDQLLGNTYTGTLHDLVEARLGTATATAVDNVLGRENMRAEVYLPDMRQAIMQRLQPAANAILAQAAIERDAYLAYWQKRVGDASCMVADVGYAGTIQTHLTRLTGRPLGGAYFAVNQAIAQTTVHGGWAVARFHDERANANDVTAVMTYHLTLEAVLSAPCGQFSHFDQTASTPRPVYLPDPRPAATYPVLAAVHGGAEHFIADLCRVAGDDLLEASLDKQLVQVPLHQLGSGQWQAGAWLEQLVVSDRYTGRGNVAIRPKPAC